jgi:hypothetical protein
MLVDLMEESDLVAIKLEVMGDITIILILLKIESNVLDVMIIDKLN